MTADTLQMNEFTASTLLTEELRTDFDKVCRQVLKRARKGELPFRVSKQILDREALGLGPFDFTPSDLVRALITKCKRAHAIACADNVPFDINPKYVLDLWIRQKGLCLHTLKPMMLSKKQPLHERMALLREDPAKGGTVGNMSLCCVTIRDMKMAMPPDEFITYVRHIREVANKMEKDFV